MLTRETIIGFIDAFNGENLDRIMTLFADDAEYFTYDGKHCKGKTEVRAAFEAQFAGRYGKLKFVKEHFVIDVENIQAAITWRCEHNLPSSDAPLPLRILQRCLALITGKKPYWEGLDILRFNAEGKLAYKHTYAKTRLPLLRRGS